MNLKSQIKKEKENQHKEMKDCERKKLAKEVHEMYTCMKNDKGVRNSHLLDLHTKRVILAILANDLERAIELVKQK